MPTLYRQLLGEAFDSLPPVLRRFHDREAGSTACLTLRVSHGRGWLCRAAAALGRLPRQSDGTSGRLQVVTRGDCEHWIRDMGGRRIETLQRSQDGLLVEKTGLLRLGFRLYGDGEGMRLTSVRGWFLGLPMPSRLTPRVTAVARGQQDAWLVDVRIELPMVGLLMQYEGKVTPE